METHAIVVAAGSGQRFGGSMPKQFLSLGDRPVLAHSLGIFEAHPAVKSIVLVGPAARIRDIEDGIIRRFGFLKVARIVEGGASRQDSVAAGLQPIEDTDGAVLVHDGARPLAGRALIDRVIAGLEGADACIPAIPCTDTVKETAADFVVRTVPRERLKLVQTPQAFRIPVLRRLLAEAKEPAATDEASLVEADGGRVRWVEGDVKNIKITRPLDLEIARLFLEYRNACE